MGDKEYPPMFDNENRKIRFADSKEINERLDSLERRIENLENAKGPDGAETAENASDNEGESPLDA